MRKIYYLFYFQFLFIIIPAQTGKNNYFPPSPELSSLVKFVDVPVNHSTGIMNYSIPIYAIKLKNITIPITLSYQSSGFKPQEIASEVGLGWELQVGGKISQQVMGQNDFEKAGPINVEVWDQPLERDYKLPDLLLGSSYGHAAPLISTAYWTPNRLDSLHAPGTDYTMFKNIHEYKLDAQADLFYYNTPTNSGKFFFAKNFDVKQIPFSKSKIEYTNGAFEIVEVDGNRYVFSTTTPNRHYTSSFGSNPHLLKNAESYSYTYYLDKIITTNNETVEFIYDDLKYNIITDKNYTRYYHSFYGGTEIKTLFGSEVRSKILKKILVNGKEEINFIHNKYRKDIKGTVSEAAPKTLDEIVVKNGSAIAEKFIFEYGYFGMPDSDFNPLLFEGANITETTGFKLKLKSVKNKNNPPYLFSYYHEQSVDRMTDCHDHWGYYSNSCDKYTGNTLFDDSNLNTKKPDLTKTLTNVLSSVKLPTSGMIKFSYELNEGIVDLDYNQDFHWATNTIYMNDDDIFTNENEIKNFYFTVPENSVTAPKIKFFLRDGSQNTSFNNVKVNIYDDEDAPVNFQSSGNGLITMRYVGDQLVKGKQYKITLEGVDNSENQEKFFTLLFLTSTNSSSAASYTPIGGMRTKEIQTYSETNLISKRTFSYEDDDNASSAILYEKPYYFDEVSYMIEGSAAENPEVGIYNFAVQYSRIPYDLFGFNGHHVFYKKVTEAINDTNSSDVIKTEKYFTFYDDLRFGDRTYFSKISNNWKRGLLTNINEFKGNDTIRTRKLSYKFWDTPPTKMSNQDIGFPLDKPLFPNEYHQRGLEVVLMRENLNFYNRYGFNNSKLISAWYYKDKEVLKEFLHGEIIKTEIDYIYSNPINAQLSKVITTFPDNSIQETIYRYADEKGHTVMVAANMVGIPLETEVKKYKFINDLDPKIISKTGINYEKKTWEGKELILPEVALSYDLQNPSVSTTEVLYKKYDSRGNLLQYNLKPDTNGNSGNPVTIIWGYNHTQPIAKIEGIGYDALMAISGMPSIITDLHTKSAADLDTATEQILITALDSVRKNSLLAAYQITTYTYDPLVGVTSITPPSGIRGYYKYDTANRLESVKDVNGNVLKEYQYHYKP